MNFDAKYYQRYYFDRRTAVASRAEMRARARLIAAMTAHAGLPVRRILEAGCGTGLLRGALRRLLPRAQYVGLETSAYLCRRYGWQLGRIEEFRTRAPFDLVICYDVLQYLDAAAAQGALRNFGRLCRGVLYFSALTRHDLKHNADLERTDADVHLRSAALVPQPPEAAVPRGGAGLLAAARRAAHPLGAGVGLSAARARRRRNSG